MTTVKSPPHLQLQVVYNGQPRTYQANLNQPLRPIFQRALADFGLQPAGAEYGLFLNGQRLDLGTKIEDLNLPENSVLVLQPVQPRRGG